MKNLLFLGLVLSASISASEVTFSPGLHKIVNDEETAEEMISVHRSETCVSYGHFSPECKSELKKVLVKNDYHTTSDPDAFEKSEIKENDDADEYVEFIPVSDSY